MLADVVMDFIKIVCWALGDSSQSICSHHSLVSQWNAPRKFQAPVMQV